MLVWDVVIGVRKSVGMRCEHGWGCKNQSVGRG